MTINIKKLLTNISIILITVAILLRPYIINFSKNNNMPIIIIAISIIILLLPLLKNNSINKENLKFPILCILILIPFFYKNAYIEDGKYNSVLYYLLIITYSCIFSISDVSTNNYKSLFKVLTLFSILTCVITWISYINTNFYISKIVALLPFEYRNSVIKMLLNNHAYAGLTDHYSRNAFFVILGIISEIYFIKKETKINIQKIIIIFFIMTLFLIGKRGHLLFFIISLIFTYFIFNNVNAKTIIKFLIIIAIATVSILILMKYVPAISNVVKRTENNNGDISTGRFELYSKAISFYNENEKKPIGYYQFKKKMDYAYAGVHNDYIQIFIETGISGIILIIGTNIYILILTIKNLKKDKEMLSFIITLYNIFFLLYSLTGIPHYDIETYATYFILNAIFFNEKQKNNKLKRRLYNDYCINTNI